jgi:hypothetical protein
MVTTDRKMAGGPTDMYFLGRPKRADGATGEAGDAIGADALPR